MTVRRAVDASECEYGKHFTRSVTQRRREDAPDAKIPSLNLFWQANLASQRFPFFPRAGEDRIGRRPPALSGTEQFLLRDYRRPAHGRDVSKLNRPQFCNSLGFLL